MIENPLVYTAAVTLITSGKTLETAGIRMQKYIPDASNVAQLIMIMYS
jgi:hypothetical protein